MRFQTSGNQPQRVVFKPPVFGWKGFLLIMMWPVIVALNLADRLPRWSN